MRKKNVFILCCIMLLRACSSAVAAEFPCDSVNVYEFSDESHSKHVASAPPWGPGGAYAVASAVGDSYYNIYYNLDENRYCQVLSDYINQIRILDRCPDGVEREMPCIEVIFNDFLFGIPKNTQILKNGQCSGRFSVLANDSHGKYRHMKEYTPTFPCMDLDKLPEQGKLLPGKVLIRDFLYSEWSEVNFPQSPASNRECHSK